MNELEALVALTHIPLLGPVKIRELVKKFGSASGVFQASYNEWMQLPGFGPNVCAKIEEGPKKENVERDLELSKKMGLTLLSFQDARYPKRLLQLHDAPALLYIKGEFLEEDDRNIAVVGTRNHTIYGAETAEKIARELTDYGFSVTSGLARGIDTSAHRGALERGRTIAVIGSGLAHIYPTENVQLARKISEKGVLISEYPTFFPPAKEHFPRRNRIVSAMSLASVLIEAPIKSGAMITMNLAYDQKRSLFALPGRVDDENFKGNHHLIKQGKAKLIEGAEDIALAFGCFKPVKERILRTEVNGEEKTLLQQMPLQEISIEELALKTNFNISKLNVLLMGLVLKNIIKEFPGKIYKVREPLNG
ncbi:MAG: DNA-processing protein DprA [Chlamydiales bacterium]|nr:DNA-processing protein DprA [Chlamydiales bacterium]